MFGKEKEKHLYPCYMKNTLFVLILLVTDEKQRMKDKAIASCMYISWIWKGKKTGEISLCLAGIFRLVSQHLSPVLE